MVERFKQVILRHVTHERYEPQAVQELAGDLGIDSGDREGFREAVQELADDGQVVLNDMDTVLLPPPGREVVGIFRKHERGFGFIVPDMPMEHGDLFVPPPNTGDALTGDRVRAKVIRERGRAGGGRSPYVGKIEEVVQRAENHYVGNLEEATPHWLVHVDGRALHDPVIIRDPHAKDARDGDKVVIDLVSYPAKGKMAEGVILEVLGAKGEPDVETVAVMRAYDLAEAFDEAVMQEAREAAGRIDESAVPEDREDLTGRFIVTIDPPDARDFDDAISLERIEKGEEVWELGVHIADVAHFVPTGSALDREARERGNSTYLPRRVIPMLPEVLSNGVCSLQEGVNRYAKSVFIRYDEAGRPRGARFSRSVIRSAKRLTYLEAQALIDGDVKAARRHARTDTPYPEPLRKTLQAMDALGRTIRERRMKEGMIHLDLPEAELVFDQSGRVIDAVPEDDAFTHEIIEMFMVESNEAVARLFDRLEVPMIRRIHPDPPVHDVEDLRQFARVAGFNIPDNPTRKELQELLEGVRGKPAQHAVHIAVLRTLSKAEYSPLPIGHFALASEHYTHFTSPIRRYADLVVHRALEAYFDHFPDHRNRDIPGGPETRKLGKAICADARCVSEEALDEICHHTSATSRNSESAERDLREYLILAMLAEQHLGDDFEGTVAGVTGAGLFVQLDKYLCDGFLPVADLPAGAGQWKLNRKTGALVAEGSGRTISIGDRFKVRIAKVNPEGRRLELALVEILAGGPKRDDAMAAESGGGSDRGGGSGGGKGGGGQGGGQGRGKGGGKGRRGGRGGKGKSGGGQGNPGKGGRAGGGGSGGGGSGGGSSEGAGEKKKRRRRRR